MMKLTMGVTAAVPVCGNEGDVLAVIKCSTTPTGVIRQGQYGHSATSHAGAHTPFPAAASKTSVLSTFCTMSGMANRGVEHIHIGHPATDGAGVRMTRVIATPELDHFDPFLLLDEFRSDDPNDYIAGFPDHPHRGFETVTYMLAGAMKHGDNKGNTGLLGPGSVQWMTAGRGIVHSEMPQQEDGLMWGFQLWVNLPAEQKMTEPRYQDIPASDVPETGIGGNVVVRVVAGELNGIKGPVSGVATEPFYFDVRCEGPAEVPIPTPETHKVFAYPYEGDISIGAEQGTLVRRGSIALLGPGTSVSVTSDEATRFILVGGKPLNEPIARYGPFVMNTADEIRQAITDFQAGRF